MATWIPRTITDQNVEHKYRYELKDINTGITINTYDIEPAPGIVTQSSTKVDATYLQPIEDFLKTISDDLAALGVLITVTNTALNSTENMLNAKIATLETTLATKAPLASPSLTNPTRNTLAQTDNSAQLVYTSWVRTYFSNLMAAYTG